MLMDVVALHGTAESANFRQGLLYLFCHDELLKFVCDFQLWSFGGWTNQVILIKSFVINKRMYNQPLHGFLYLMIGWQNDEELIFSFKPALKNCLTAALEIITNYISHPCKSARKYYIISIKWQLDDSRMNQWHLPSCANVDSIMLTGSLRGT